MKIVEKRKTKTNVKIKVLPMGVGCSIILISIVLFRIEFHLFGGLINVGLVASVFGIGLCIYSLQEIMNNKSLKAIEVEKYIIRATSDDGKKHQKKL